MTQIVTNYAVVLYELGITKSAIAETKEIYGQSPELRKVLESPVIRKPEKHKVIERVFDKSMHSFLKVLSDYQSMALLPQILDEYKKVYHQKKDILMATLYYVNKPDKEQEEKILAFLLKHYKKQQVRMVMKQKPELVGGFVVKVGDHEFDYSLRGRFKELEKRLSRR